MLLSIFFSFGYVRYYQHKRERECGSTTVAVLALTVALLTGALIPVDIFLVSTLKGHDGQYHDWASYDVRQEVKDMVTYAYYGATKQKNEMNKEREEEEQSAEECRW